jgi:hypothetical protein
MVTVPACKTVTVSPDTMAIFELELAYENAPVLLDIKYANDPEFLTLMADGSINLNVSPLIYGRSAIVKPVIIGGALLITNVAFMLAAV